ncbi:MAG: single-stranded-DNA-specific exonuclease RecJ [Chitinophagales bacterium]
MMKKKWVIKDVDEQIVDELYHSLKINRTLCKLLAQRGITTYDEATKFFRPSYDHLYDPFLMEDMDKAVERIDYAMRKKEKILVYGDYDVDGTTAVALVYSFLKELYFHVSYYVPDRYAEGYGVSYQGIDFAHKNGYSLIIALDCGIKAHDKVAHAKTLGIDFIICDHHRPGDVLPPAFAVLDPKRKDCNYPYDELSGCGVGFKLVQAFAERKGIEFHKVTKLLDLVVVSIAADIVPITDENRVLAYFGLQRLNRSPRPGFRSLIELSELSRKPYISISDIVFNIAPRINAAGRMDKGTDAVSLLVASEGMLAKKGADLLQKKNFRRRKVDAENTKQALALVENTPSDSKKKATILYKNDWHKGVIGIVASRLLEKFYRPTIIMTRGEAEGEVAGSARSVKNFDIYNAIKECSELLEQFGGHKYAAGLTMKEENVPAFIKKFEKVVADTIEDDMLIPEIEIDTELELKNVNPRFFNILRQFSPFGPGNTKPVFIAKSVMDTGWTRLVGIQKNHLRIYATHDGVFRVKGIGYNLGHKFDYLKDSQPFDMCFTIEETRYNGQVSLQIRLKDLEKISEPPASSIPMTSENGLPTLED